MAADHAELFNRKLTEFLDDLEAIGIDRLPDYALFKTSTSLLMTVDKRRPAAMFCDYIATPYEQYIVARDDKFFLADSFTHPHGGNTSIVDMIKQMWATLQPANQDAIWSHLQVLTVLAKRARATYDSQ